MPNLLSKLIALPAAVFESVNLLIARDSWIRSARQRTVGTITGLEEVEKESFGSSGQVYHRTEYSITYAFNVDGFRFLTGKKIGNNEEGRARRKSLKVGDKIAVYYRHTPLPVATTGREVQPLSNDSVEAIEAFQNAAHERGRSARGKVFAIHQVGALTREGTDKYVDADLVRYEFADEQGRRWRGTKLVESRTQVKSGSDVKVRYLPDQPEVNTLETTAA